MQRDIFKLGASSANQNAGLLTMTLLIFRDFFEGDYVSLF